VKFHKRKSKTGAREERKKARKNERKVKNGHCMFQTHNAFDRLEPMTFNSMKHSKIKAKN
jgi:hypothetical protein